MRAFKKGELFMDVEATTVPKSYPRSTPCPVFSEGNLYPRMTKDDARFILAVAEEYDALIKRLGTKRVKELLGEKEE